LHVGNGQGKEKRTPDSHAPTRGFDLRVLPWTPVFSPCDPDQEVRISPRQPATLSRSGGAQRAGR
jgi:hypothetical protein